MGTISLPEDQQRFLNWLIDPRPEGAAPSDTTKGTQNNMARVLGLDKSTLSKWKKDPRFVQAWQEQLLEAMGGPEAMAAMNKVLMEVALDKKNPAAARVAAVRQYQEVSDKYSPKTQIKVADPSLLNRDDNDLILRIDTLLSRAREARRSLGIDGRSMPLGKG